MRQTQSIAGVGVNFQIVNWFDVLIWFIRWKKVFAFVLGNQTNLIQLHFKS